MLKNIRKMLKDMIKKKGGKGNINLKDRPKVHNPDGSISTIRSISFNEGGKEILVPSVIGDKVVSNKEAYSHYKQTGEHLGKFDSIEAADKYAEKLHKREAKLLYKKKVKETKKSPNPYFNLIKKMVRNSKKNRS